MTPITRPKNLTAKAWRDNKGLFTKTVTDASGLGKALDTLDTDWAKVSWGEAEPDEATARLTVNGFNSTYTVANVTRLKDVAHQHAAQVAAVKQQLGVVERLARETAARWKANKLVPSSSVKYVGEVQTAAHTLVERLNKLDAGWTARLEAAGVSEKLIWQKLNSQITSRIGLLRNAAQAVLDMHLAADAATLTASQKLHEALNELIPLVKISHDPADHALYERLIQVKNGDHTDITKAWTGLSKKPEVATPAHNELRHLAQQLEAAVHGM